MSATNKKTSDAIAIVGMACRFPMADSPSEYWANILNKKDCLAPIPSSHWSVDDYYSQDPKAPDMTYAKKGGFINQVAFDPMKYSIPPAALEATDTSQLLGMVVAHEALIDAGYGKDKHFNRDKVSVILGVTGALELVIPLGARLGHPIWRKALLDAGISAERTEQIVEKIAAGYVPWQENSFPGLLGNVVAGRIANALDLGGTNCVVDAACASSLSAVHLACLELQSGRSDLALTGGIDTFNDIFMYMCFSKTPALSPSGEASPFSAMGDGTILGEGLGVLALKRLEDATRDGDHVYAVIKGLGSSSDGKGNAIYAPSADGQKKALKRTYELAEVAPETIELVEGHGTGTKVGDAIEAKALSDVYGTSENGPWCAIGSVKSQIGHTKAAAGVAGLMKAAMALHRKVLPPTLKVEEPVAVLKQDNAPLYVNTHARPWLAPEGQPRRAAVSAFGFGGSNFHCVLEELTPKKTVTDWDGLVQILAFSGADRQQLISQLTQWTPQSTWHELELFAAKTRAAFDKQAAARLMLVVEKDKTQLDKIRENAKSLLVRYQDKDHWSAPEGIVFGSGKRLGKLGVLFPGQGSQYTNMFRDLACRFPQFQEVLHELNQVSPDLEDAKHSWRFSDLIYPVPAWDEESRKKQQSRLTKTQIAQPAIGAVSMGALEIVRHFGVEPEAVAGHSFGEITALCASGRFSDDAFYLLSRLRGRLMAQGSGDKGAMLAVRAPQSALEKLIKDHGLDLVMANKNAPDQTVLSGASHEITRAAQLLDKEGLRHKRLPVAAAFHSSLVGQAREPFYAELSKLDFPKAKIPVYANATAEIYPDDPDAARNLLANQLLKPVEFVDEIGAMYADGVRTFLEVGPGARLTGLVKSILKGQSFEAFALDASSGKRSGLYDLARVLANLAALGFDVDLKAWEMGGPSQEPITGKNKMTVWLSGANHKSKQTLAKAAKPLPKLPEQPKPPAPRAIPAATMTSQKPLANRSPVPAASSKPRVTQVMTPMTQDRLNNAMALSNKHLEMLQNIQAQTAALHQQFLEGQQAAHRSLAALIQQQQQGLGGQSNAAVSSLPTPVVEAAPALASPKPTQVSAVPVAKPEPIQVKSVAPAVTNPAQPGPDIEKVLLKVLSEKTGYPEDMLELDMQLDADLGVDSIKRVEILSAMQEILPQVEPVAPEDLGRLHSLRDVVTLMTASQKAHAPSAPAASNEQSQGSVRATLMQVVGEKTGYPVDMLEPHMQLDADLGIDSIKRVEILSALQAELPQAPEFKPDEMGSLHTLADILAKLETALPEKAPAVSQPQVAAGKVTETLMKVVAEKTGYPADMLELAMQLDADLGIDSIKRVEILSALQEALPHLPTVEAEDISSMQTLGDIVEHLNNSQTANPVANPSETPTSHQARATLLAIIAEKTGYPENMLEAGMGLEADLGIDSIKRVEILSALSESLPQLPEVKADEVGRFQTIGDIFQYLENQAPTSATPANTEEIWPSLLAIVAEKTGYPEDMLEPSMSLEADLGIDSIKRVEILSALQDRHPELPEVPADKMGSLQTLEEIKLSFDTTSVQPKAPVVAVKAAAAQSVATTPTPAKARPAFAYRLNLGTFEAKEEVQLTKGSCLWLTAAQTQWGQALSQKLTERGYQVFKIPADWEVGQDISWPAPSGLILLAPQQVSPEFPKQALFLAKEAGKQFAASSNQCMLASISFLGGDFATQAYPEGMDPLAGALAGLVKTAGIEWERVHCRALDMAFGDVDSDTLGSATQALFAKGPIELALAQNQLKTFEMVQVKNQEPAEPVLEPQDVVLVTGGARGVTAACLQRLAETLPLRFVLLGRTAPPADQEPAWLESLTSEADVRKGLLTQLETRPTPKALAEMAAGLLREREIRQNLQALREKGSKVLYAQVDVNDQASVKTLIADVKQKWGSVKGLVHGAGVLADRLILDKTPEQFDRVWKTKVIALETLLEALANEPLKMVGLFSSSTARFGRKGQVDYAMANEAMNKMGAQVRSQRPNCQVMAWNWGPWAGGMVTPELEKVFAAEGVALIDLSGGADIFLQGLCARESQQTEWVVLGDAVKANLSDTPSEALHVIFEKQFSLEQLPFLKGHAMNDAGILPMAMMLEWMAHTAITDLPGLHFLGLDGLRVLKAVRFGVGETHTLRFMAGKAEKADGIWRVPIALQSGAKAQPVRHAHGVAILGNQPLSAEVPSLAKAKEVYTKSASEVYGMLFHRAPFLAIEKVLTYSDEGITAQVSGAPQPKEWMDKPLRSKWLSDPLLIDAGFQMMVLWCIERYGMPSLPTFFGAYRQFGEVPSGDNFEVVVSIQEVAHQKVTADMEFRHLNNGSLIAKISGYECVMDSSLNQAFRRNRLPQEVLN